MSRSTASPLTSSSDEPERDQDDPEYDQDDHKRAHIGFRVDARGTLALHGQISNREVSNGTMMGGFARK
jgi:hypothetical protein